MGTVTGKVTIDGVAYPVAAGLTLPTSGDPRWVIGADGQRYRPDGSRWDVRPADASNTGWKTAPNAPSTLPNYNGSIAAGQTVKNVAISAGLGIGSTSTPNPHVTFQGCQLVGPAPESANVVLWGDYATFDHCTFQPNLTFTPGIQVTKAQSYQYGLTAGSGWGSAKNLTVKNCDFWGFGNAICISGPGSFLIDHNWIHDACVDPAAAYHTDGIGYLNGTDGISNAVITNNTIESAGNTNGIAFQQGTYGNNLFAGNYDGGWGFTVAIWKPSTKTRFVMNTFSTELPCIWGPLYGQDWLANDPANQWGGAGQENLWHSKTAAGGNLGWGKAANDGKVWKYSPGTSVGNPQTNDSLFVA